jgi:hypothetical protein
MIAEQAVRITEGPSPWAYVTGGSTISATVIGLIAILFAESFS